MSDWYLKTPAAPPSGPHPTPAVLQWIAAGQVTGDHALSTLQMLGIMSSPRAITTVPHGDAKLARQVLPGIVAMPLEDAAPATVSLLWREDASGPLLEDLIGLAKRVARSEDEL